MLKIIKGSVYLLTVALVVGFSFLEPRVEAVTLSAEEMENSVERYEVNLKVESEAGVAAPNMGGTAYKATAYCLRGKTASGRYVKRGIVAADPRVLRLGTRIRMTGGRYTGNYLVADTGGKIKGRILDIWVPSCKEARAWGRRTVTVKILSKPKPKKRRRKKK